MAIKNYSSGAKQSFKNDLQTVALIFFFPVFSPPDLSNMISEPGPSKNTAPNL